MGAHHWAREFGHEVQLMPPPYVRPYVKTNKDDAADAEGCCEAVQRPSMRFVPVKSETQQSLLMLHRIRDRLAAERSASATLRPAAIHRHMKRDADLQVLMPLVVCFGLALFSASLHLSTALGAFVAGIVIPASRSTAAAEHSLHAATLKRTLRQFIEEHHSKARLG